MHARHWDTLTDENECNSPVTTMDIENKDRQDGRHHATDEERG